MFWGAASSQDLSLYPKPTTSINNFCVALYMCVGATALYRSVVPTPLPISRLKVFQYLVATFSFVRSLSFVTEDALARDVINRSALCVFFTLVLFQVFFWIDIVNPGLSVRSKRIWNIFVTVNLIFYLFVLVLQLVNPSRPRNATDPADSDDDSDDDDYDPTFNRVNFWSDLLPVLLVALGSLASSIAMLYLSCKMRLRVQRLVDEHDTSLSQVAIAAMYRALAFLNAVLLISSMLFAMRTAFYMQRPWSHKECGAIQDPDVCILVGYVLPEMVPCVLFLMLMWEVDPRLWITRLSATETTPLLRKPFSTFDTQHEMWPRKSPHVSRTRRPSTPSSHGAAPWSSSSAGGGPASHAVDAAAAGSDALWLSFQAFHLHCPNDVHSSFVVVHDATDAATEIGRTDIAHTKDPVYHVMLKVPTATSVCIRVYAIRNINAMPDPSTQWLVGEVLLEQPPTLVPGQAHLYLLNEDVPTQSGLLVVRCEATTAIDTSQHLTRAFIFQDQPKILVEEELVESPFTWDIPHQLLQLIVADLTQKLDHLKMVSATEAVSVALRPDNDDRTSSLLSDMIYHLQGNKRRRTNHKWRVEMIQLMETYLAQVGAALTADRPMTFKPSTKKADPGLRFLALNLHAQMLTMGAAVPDDEVAKEAGWDDEASTIKVEGPAFRHARLFGTITVGAFAAHVYGFHHGGVRQLRENWDRLREQSQHAVGTDLAVVQRDMHVLEWQIDQRLDVAFTQAVSALVTAFQQTLYVHFHTSAMRTLPTVASHVASPSFYLTQLQQHGFLFNVESLLSTVGSEAGMLGDMDAAVKALAHVTIQLHVVPCATFTVSITSSGLDGLVIEVPLLADEMTHATMPMTYRIPGQDKATGAVYLPPSIVLEVGTRLDVKVVPVLFNQGINEVQTVANTVGKSQLQEDINLESSELLEAYLVGIAAPPAVVEAWTDVKRKIQDPKAEKVMDILATTSWIARQVGGGRVTCCKSAKDRTAMSVTLEEAQWMDETASREDQAVWTQLLRTYGVRRENARKNIGTAQYAFNALQNYMLPLDYKCPPGTGGATKS
ncbi:Aste57867_15301 [Aphanomyces stellatus]|uniref:Aste57867_15301 protein n=1 Tax=Aphanomyces stellatus TaxID=120398 RepID=A0A485L338_9STRA|nr:hypothetical protein As57867_015245 [Aphanomyces stellatus]VFT92110.1 Aste57867_15301 [Aphanomyces stellatus]